MFIRLNIIVLYRTLRNRTVPKLFRQTARKYPKKIAFHCEEKTWTFEQVSQINIYVSQIFTFTTEW